MFGARRVGVACVATAILVNSACSGEQSAPPKPQPATSFTSYVAMGDSSVAGPDIAPTDPRSGLCARSKSNWPHLLADTLEIPSVSDVSCSSAVSVDIFEARDASNAAHSTPQIDALSADTDLVTISIGGNDEGLFSKIVLYCLAGRFSTATCESFIDTKLDRIVTRTAAGITASLERIKASAPNARIVMVGYLRILPEAGGCAMPDLDPARVRSAGAGMDAMTKALETAATRADVEYVSMRDESAGHEACTGANAWVNGTKRIPGDGALLHPNAAGMHAIAQTVADHLTS